MKRVSLIVVILLLVVIVTGCKSDKVIYEDDLLFYLDFDENDEYVIDKSDNMKLSFLVENVYNIASFKESSPALRRTGIKGNSLSFDGWSNFINTKSSKGFEKNGSISVNVWIAPRVWELPSDILCPIIEYYDSSNDSGFIFGYSKYGTWGLRMKFSGSGWIYISDPNNKLVLYDWTNLGFSYDEANDMVYLYKDGKEIIKTNVSGKRERALSTLKIGINTYNQTAIGLFKHNMFSGLMDELLIYNRYLNFEDHTKLFENGLDKDGNIIKAGYDAVQYPKDYLKNDIYKPSYHSSANIDWSSDASGGFYYKGMYHQFYQSDDTGPIWRTFTWGHLVSSDMVNWYSVEPAIYAEDNKVDSYSTFAGSAIVINDIPYIIYTGIANNDSETSKLSIATPVDLSDPELKKWKKLDTIITLPESVRIRGEFRDPFVYTEKDNVYILATASASVTGDIRSGNPSILCFKANKNDLTKWEYKGVFFTLDFSKQKQIGFMWELPQLYKLTSPNGTVKYMFSCTPVRSDDIINDMLYWIGDVDFNTCRFIPLKEETTLLDNGSNVLCAGSGFYDPNTNQNMSTSVVQCVGQRSEVDRVLSGWVGCYQLYRNYSLNDDLTLSVKFNSAYESLHDEKLIDVNEAKDLDDIDLSDIHSKTLHIKINMDVRGSSKAGLNVLTNVYNNQGVSFYYEEENERMVFNTLYSKSEVLLCNYEYFTVNDGIVEMDIYVDKSVVEIVVNGKYAFTARAFTNIDSNLIKFVGQDWKILSMQVYTMKSIF